MVNRDDGTRCNHGLHAGDGKKDKGTGTSSLSGHISAKHKKEYNISRVTVYPQGRCNRKTKYRLP